MSTSRITVLRPRHTGDTIREMARVHARDNRREQIYRVLTSRVVGFTLFACGAILALGGANSIGLAIGTHTPSLAGPGAWCSIIFGGAIAAGVIMATVAGEQFRDWLWHALGGH